ncbi:regulatory protein RecX [Alicyclobacillus pomorum]|uniref:regulatory protein RecX n=1 Tax=Alicyclobacillus pomorum TaxID=204470 RepID=UPI00040F4AC1|nr:RecX family transcriptional regulator [Alicyclobacillus pomorum]
MTNDTAQVDMLVGYEEIPGAPDLIRLRFAEHATLDVFLKDFVDYNLRVNSSLSAEQLKQLEEGSIRALFYHKALNYLRFRPRTKSEVIRYLQRLQCSTDMATSIVQELESLRYIDDVQYAQQFVEAKGTRLSRKELLWKLRQRGIAASVAEEVLRQSARHDECSVAMALAVRQWRKYRGEVPARRRDKVGAFLHRKGFPMSLIYQVLDAVSSAEDEDGDLS